MDVSTSFKRFKQIALIKNCGLDLQNIKKIINIEIATKLKGKFKFRQTQSQDYLEVSSVILAYSTIEVLAKDILYDFLSYRKTPTFVIEYIKQTIYSNNIDVQTLYGIIRKFDVKYENTLKKSWGKIPKFSQYSSQMKSLKALRNTLSHRGGRLTCTIQDIITYFNSSIVLLYHMYKMFKKNHI